MPSLSGGAPGMIENQFGLWKFAKISSGKPTVIGDASGLLGKQYYSVVIRDFVKDPHA